MTEQHIRIAAKLYECRDTAKRFFKDEYPETLMPYTDILKKVMKANDLDEIKSLLKISETNMYQDSAMAQLLFMAATVELIESNGKLKKE